MDVLLTMCPTPNHSLQRTRPLRSGCNPRGPWAGSLSLDRSALWPQSMTSPEMNDSKYRISHWDSNNVSTLIGWLWVGAVVLLLTGTVPPAEAGQSKGPRAFIPQIANTAGIKVGYSSMAELERKLGKGRVTIGGHPNGARLWRVKGTSWVIYADAFEYSRRGAVVDRFEITGDRKSGDYLPDITVDPAPGQQVPFGRLTGHELAWAGGISLGIGEDKLLKLLKQKSWTPVKLAAGWRVEAQGHSALTSNPLYPYHKWSATFTMKGNSLVGISLDAMQGRTE